MKCYQTVVLLIILCLSVYLRGQTATITGLVFDEEQNVLEGVNITSGKWGTATDSNGFFLLQVTAEQENTIIFSHVGHEDIILENLVLNTSEIFEINPVLKINITQIAGVTISPTGEKTLEQITFIPPEIVRNIPGINAGVENILKLLPGVSSNNELSTQYSVRGGNYDENLVYVNEIEVYRPFLIRSAQQEGHSFVNSSLVKKIKFSAGGFQAKYGDKLSSVLDITYKDPVNFGAELDFSLLGASMAVETISKNGKLSQITGIRYKNNLLLLNSLDTQANLNPVFADIQSYFTYKITNKLHLNFLGNISINDYQNRPLNRQTNFGTLSEPKALVVHFDGNENIRYKTALGALKANYFVNNDLSLKLISSIYHTIEEEHSDVIARYGIGEIDTDLASETLGIVTSSRSVGSQINRARNDLDALIFNLEHKGHYSKQNKQLQWGIKYTHEDIRDQLRESEFIDSAGYSIRPPLPEYVNNQPEIPFNAPLFPWVGKSARNFVKINRLSAFGQFSDQKTLGTNDIYYNVGIRAQNWNLNGENISKNPQLIVSPRFQFALKPQWKNDVLFKFSSGIYHQPPFYRELRNEEGQVQSNVKAQKAMHFVLGNEYSFLLWNRPFTLIGEAYYKKLNNVNTYTIEDLRIRYAANNKAEAYVYGFETRLNGAFVPGTESWISLGFLKTEENIENRGYISRPTDQRFKLGILFQDYVPDIPDLKMYLNLVYNSGVPGGSPSYADPYIFQNRLRDFKRADLGISHIFVNENKSYPKDHWLYKFKELSVGIEIFNLFNNKNSITNTWVRDVESKTEYAIPNYLTGRVLNLRLKMRF